MQPKPYENYPCWIMLISNFVSIVIYLIGAFIISQIGLIWLCLYLLYIVWLEIRIMKKSCVNCFYYGKYCAFGRGKISSWFFKKGSSNKFLKRKITWKDILPDFLVSIIPFIAGIVLLILNFNWLLLILIVLLAILTSAGNGFVRSNLACKFCKQRKIGCPAEQLFNKRK
jgi:Co/Zn/Cd efflux system component